MHGALVPAIFDDTLGFEEHSTELCRTSFFHIRNISGIRPCLSIDSTKTLVHALVTSPLDYSSVLLYGLPYLIQSLKYASYERGGQIKIIKLTLASESLIMSHHHLLSYTSFPSVNSTYCF